MTEFPYFPCNRKIGRLIVAFDSICVISRTKWYDFVISWSGYSYVVGGVQTLAGQSNLESEQRTEFLEPLS